VKQRNNIMINKHFLTLWNNSPIHLLVFIYGGLAGLIASNHNKFLEIIKDFGDLLAVISALLAVAVTISYQESLRRKKISALHDLVQDELDLYIEQMQDFLLRTKHALTGLTKPQWENIKLHRPQTPNIFKNYDFLLEFDADFIGKIAKVNKNYERLNVLTRRINSLLKNSGTIIHYEREIEQEIKFFEEFFAFCMNNISTRGKFVLPESSVFNIFK